MNRYEEYVEAIRKITGLDVPVIFNDEEAKFNGPYFGYCGFEDEIAPDPYEWEMYFDYDNFLTNDHINLFHIGLPERITGTHDVEFVPIMNDLLKSAGIKYSPEAAEVFIILHEFGHAYELYVKYGKDVTRYVQAKQKRDSDIYRLKFLERDEQQWAYRQVPCEKEADDFAKKYIAEVLKELKLI